MLKRSVEEVFTFATVAMDDVKCSFNGAYSTMDNALAAASAFVRNYNPPQKRCAWKLQDLSVVHRRRGTEAVSELRKRRKISYVEARDEVRKIRELRNFAKSEAIIRGQFVSGDKGALMPYLVTAEIIKLDIM